MSSHLAACGLAAMLQCLLMSALVALCAGEPAARLSDIQAMYYINLDDCPLRRQHIEQQLRVTNLPAKRFPAVSAERVAAGEYDKEIHQGLDNATLQLSPRVANATTACFLSHFHALKQLAGDLEPNQVGLIMEDDVVIPSDWEKQFEATMQAAPQDWRLLKISGWGSSREEDVAKQSSFWSRMKSKTILYAWSSSNFDPGYKYYTLKEPFSDPDDPMKLFYAGTGAYLVRGAGIASILEHLSSRPIKDVDSMLLSNSSIGLYEQWPHIFDLSKDAFAEQGGSFHSNARIAWETDSKDAAKQKRKFIRPHDPSALDVERDSGEQEVVSIGAGGIMRRDAKAATVGDVVQVAAPFEHPPWLHECKKIYLDIGSNIGVQVRKLFQPEGYPGAPVLPLFEQHFGSPEYRALPGKQSGLCALGFEPNPGHIEHLEQLVEGYTKKGWYVHFYPYAAWREEGSMFFDQSSDPRNDDWGAHLADGSTGKDHKIKVRTVDLAQFVKTLPPNSVKLMKMDIEGAEYATIPRMINQKVLCKGVIDQAFIEAHAWGNTEHWQGNRSYNVIEKVVKSARCGQDSSPTILVDLDDESYHDHYEAAPRPKMQRPRHPWWFSAPVLLVICLVGFVLGYSLLGRTVKAEPLGCASSMFCGSFYRLRSFLSS